MKPKIEKGIKPPTRIQLPLKEMGIGDSILLSDISPDIKRTVQTRLSTYKRQNKNFNYTARQVKDGFRIWRI